MMTIHSILPKVLAILVGMAVPVLGPSPARAQWGMGWGWGWGGFRSVPSPTDFLNERANIQASRSMQARPSHSPYANNPNAYLNRIRDNGFVPRFDVRRRQPPSYQPELTASRGNTGQVQPQPAEATETPKPALPLASFFDASLRLVWPNDAPNSGDLREKRDISDQASLAVLEEAKRQGVASITSATNARQKLLDYGRPALREIRATATPRIADTFHLFLLSLYESLAQTASPPEVISATRPEP